MAKTVRYVNTSSGVNVRDPVHKAVCEVFMSICFSVVAENGAFCFLTE